MAKLDLSKVRHSTIRDAAKNMGWEDDEPMNNFSVELSNMEPLEVMRKWAEWNLGDRTWADEFITRYEELKESKK